MTKKKCVDCGFVGELNEEITYRGDEYICFPCRKDWEKENFPEWELPFKVFGRKIIISIWSKLVSKQ